MDDDDDDDDGKEEDGGNASKAVSGKVGGRWGEERLACSLRAAREVSGL